MFLKHSGMPMKALLGVTFSALLLGISSLGNAQGVPQAWGYNFYGALGDGTKTNRNSPVSVVGLTDVVQIVAGYDFTVALKSDGTVWTWGASNGSTTPVQVGGLTDIVQVACGNGHTLALKVDGSLYAWGGNGVGQLGDGTTTTRNNPVPVVGMANVVSIGCGGVHSLAVKSDGTLWAWGWNNALQLGSGSTALNGGNYSSVPVQCVGLTGILQATGGFYHSIALKSDGTVWGWGMNSNGQSGTGGTVPVMMSGISGAVSVGAGQTHSLAVKSDGTVWAWGLNNHGQLGDGTTAQRNSPSRMTGVTGAVMASGGDAHSVVLKSDGTVWCTGANNRGQLGDGTNNERSTVIGAIGLTGQTMIAARREQSFSLNAANLANRRDTAANLANATVAAGGPITFNGGLVLAGTSFPLGGRSLTFSVDGTAVGSGTTSLLGLASFSTTTNSYSVGTHTLTVDFGGDTINKPCSASATLTITRSNVTFTMSGVTGYIGQTVSLKAVLRRKSDSTVLEGKKVTFKVNGAEVGSANTDSTGTALLSYLVTDAFGVASVDLAASFAGDATYRAGTSSTVKLTVTKGRTTLTSGNVTAKRGVAVAVKGTLKRSGDGGLLSGKTITFNISGIGTFTATTDASGVASFDLTVDASVAPGKYAMTLSFAGDSLYLATSKSGLTITVK